MSNFRFKAIPQELTGSEVRIMEYIYKNLDQVPFLPIRELSQEMKISTATLSRFARHLGYRNLRQLKMEILKAERISPEKKLKSVVDQEETLSVAELMEREIENLRETMKQISSRELEKAVEAASKAVRIYVYGKGASRSLAYLMNFRLKRYGLNCRHMEDSGSEIFEDMAGMMKEDLMILYGFGKMPLETRILLEHAKKTGCPAILFTDQTYIEASFGELIVIYAYRGEAEEYHSMTSPSALTDIFLLLLGQRLSGQSLAHLSQLFELKEAYQHQLPR